tara:strand:+ start:1124 stop:1798 length:675 start_codon:yes stop_codon:yes gene_type:complete
MTLKGKARWDFKNDKAIAEAVWHARIPLCISDPNLFDNPIVFANQAFMDLTGYTEDEVIGQNCRFLQGVDTSAESIKAVRDAISGQRVETVEILNYRKDGRIILLAYSPKGAEQFELKGTTVELPTYLLSCIALGLHEFATNSVKYGALGTVDGRVNVAWDVNSDDDVNALSLRWRESKGPKVIKPTRHGGSKIVKDLIEAVGGSVEMNFDEDGLIVTANFPLT